MKPGNLTKKQYKKLNEEFSDLCYRKYLSHPLTKDEEDKYWELQCIRSEYGRAKHPLPSFDEFITHMATALDMSVDEYKEWQYKEWPDLLLMDKVDELVGNDSGLSSTDIYEILNNDKSLNDLLQNENKDEFIADIEKKIQNKLEREERNLFIKVIDMLEKLCPDEIYDSLVGDKTWRRILIRKNKEDRLLSFDSWKKYRKKYI